MIMSENRCFFLRRVIIDRNSILQKARESYHQLFRDSFRKLCVDLNPVCWWTKQKPQKISLATYFCIWNYIIVDSLFLYASAMSVFHCVNVHFFGSGSIYLFRNRLFHTDDLVGKCKRKICCWWIICYKWIICCKQTACCIFFSKEIQYGFASSREIISLFIYHWNFLFSPFIKGIEYSRSVQ